MAEATTRVKALLDAGWEVCTADEVRLEHEAWTRRMQPPKEGSAPSRSVDRKKTSQSFFGALSLTSKKVKLYPIEGNQNTEQTILALERLQRETETEKIAVVLDNARFHHAKALTDLHEPGRLLERITPIHPPPYAPDHQPGRARPEHRQEQHHHHPARDPRRNHHRIRPTRHRPHRRPQLRTPPTPRNQKRFCFMTAIVRAGFVKSLE
ncbi:transposase [Propionibacterium acidifaciens]